LAGLGRARQGGARHGGARQGRARLLHIQKQGEGMKNGNDKESEKTCSIEWAYTHNLRQVFGKQQRAAASDGEMLYQRTGAFGFSINKPVVVSLCTEYRECHTTSGRKRIQRGL